MGFVTAHLALQVAATSSSTPGSPGGGTSLWVIAVLALLSSSVIAGIVSAGMSNLRAAAAARREGYARAVKTLIARSEYPYRVRRRTSDDPDVLAALVERGHDLQEQLASCRTWVASEHHVLGRLFEQALNDIDAHGRGATSDAWDQAPISTAAGMNLGDWGPGDQRPHVARLERAISYRFGWRRVSPSQWWLRRI